jgi:ATP-dependent helicase Lhr and Lhr-like helicase
VNDNDLLELLSEIEARELPLLSWGITSGCFTEQELLDLIAHVAPHASADDVLDALLDRGLIVSKGLIAPIYRTRMAETVRLAANLRQWFHGGDWRTARTLVSDVRFLSRTRSIPRREQTPQQVNADLASALGRRSDRFSAAATLPLSSSDR